MKLLDLILPVRCVVCGAGGEQLCPACRGALPRLGRAALRPLRRSDRLARRAVPRVRRPPPRVRLGPRRGRVRRGGPAPRARLEGAWPAHARRRRGRRRRRRRCRRPAVAALAFVPADRARGLERGHHPAERLARELGERWSLPVTGAARQDETRLAAARAVTPRPPAQRRRRVRPCRRVAGPRRAGRRRLHQRLDRERRRERAAQGGRAPGRGDYVRAGRPLDSSRRSQRRRRRRCSSR